MTSEERIEVAARLRRQLKYMRENDSYTEDVDVLGCGNTAYRNIAWSVDQNSNWEKGLYVHIVERLADLIDPTCHVDVNKHGRAYCTNCGCDDWCLADGSHFCPNCGARVVSDGE